MDDLDHKLRVFLASAPQRGRSIQTIELSHSDLSSTWRLWREPTIGEITTEDGVVDVMPANLLLKLAGSESNLDQKYEINLDTVDADDMFRNEMDRIPLATNEKVRAVYREYLSTDLTEPLVTAVLQVESVGFKKGAATLSAVSPRLNITRTGELYAPRDIPMLRNFV